MLKTCLVALLISGAAGEPDTFQLDRGTLLVYQKKSAHQENPFVIRIGRFQPDIVLEWESVNHQGTVHMFSEAVESAKRFSLHELFEAGVDIESRDSTVQWLSRHRYQELLEKGSVELKSANRTYELKKKGEESRLITVNKQEVPVTVVVAKDNQRGEWAFLKDPSNPLLVEYRSPYYSEELQLISTDPSRKLRWIRALPPVR